MFPERLDRGPGLAKLVRMFARASSATLVGVHAQPVVAEAHRVKGLPGLALVGLPRGAVRESLVRVKSALAAAGLVVGTQRIVVNLLPAELPKDASALDLALAVALLASAEVIPLPALEGRRFYGELSLGGGLEAVRGAVIVADLSRTLGERELVVPLANAAEAASIPGVRVVGADDLGAVVRHLLGEAPLTPARGAAPVASARAAACLSEVRGQARAKRALEIAAAGAHNLLLMGPPGSGKTMIARRLPGILPPLGDEERIEVTRIHSASGVLAGGLLEERPFRAPHHSSSDAALCGGGSPIRAGEVTLAHRGVLFLDELPEFSRRALEGLREPLEDGHIHIARAQHSMLMPARALLVAAMNPCPCGYHRDVADEATTGRVCICSHEELMRYRSRVSGPLLDRIDLHVLVEPVPYREYAEPGGTGPPSSEIRQRVIAARAAQRSRFGSERTNAMMEAREVEAHVRLGEEGTRLIQGAIDRLGLSTRAVGRVLKVARTVADLAGASAVHEVHVREALSLRVLDYDVRASFEDGA